ncbi:hypothetical protein [Nocardia sp. NPDC049149]|uniref:hypothetical protein n=1 Tax=Nocardia sp. NPDC049149 TaxID=3364315 RepID=UPI00371E620D
MPQDNGDTFRSAHSFATNWAALLVIALGVLAFVGMIPGLLVLDELDGAAKVFVQVDITISMAATFLAATLAGSAAGIIADVDHWRVEVIHRRLHWSIVFGVLAALTLVVAALSVAFADKPASAVKPSSVIAVFDGKAYCGPLVLAPDGTVAVRGFPLHRATSVVTVDSCPTYRTR